MAITEKELREIKATLDHSARPLFLFDDDCDGVTSFLQLYRMKGEGKGVPVKASPVVEPRYARKVEEYGPDLIVILDKPMVAEEFFDAISTPVLWLDHHQPQDVKRWDNVRYYNPRLHDDKDNSPTSHWAYQVAGGPLWLATVGAVADWYLPPFLRGFEEEYRDLLPKKRERVEDLLFSSDSKLGKLIKIISFSLKGTTQETMRSVLVLTRVETPYEILNQTTPRGKFLFKKYQRLAKLYESLLHRAKHAATGSQLLHFTYEDNTMSLTSDLGNELLYLFPDQLVLIGRRHEGMVKYSLRSAGKYPIPPLLTKALEGIDGYGGGHTYACGACVKEQDDARFVAAIRKQVDKH